MIEGGGWTVSEAERKGGKRSDVTSVINEGWHVTSLAT